MSVRTHTHTHTTCYCKHPLCLHALYTARLARSAAAFAHTCLDAQHHTASVLPRLTTVVLFVPFCTTYSHYLLFSMVLLQLNLVSSEDCVAEGCAAGCKGSECGSEFTRTHARTRADCWNTLHALYTTRLARSAATFTCTCLDLQHHDASILPPTPSLVFFVPFCTCFDCTFSMVLLRLRLVT